MLNVFPDWRLLIFRAWAVYRPISPLEQSRHPALRFGIVLTLLMHPSNARSIEPWRALIPASIKIKSPRVGGAASIE